jgi:hypothetical protein
MPPWASRILPSSSFIGYLPNMSKSADHLQLTSALNRSVLCNQHHAEPRVALHHPPPQRSSLAGSAGAHVASVRHFLSDEAADGEPQHVDLVELHRTEKSDGRDDVSSSISAGSQLSRFPRKCWTRTSGTPPSPASRYTYSMPLAALTVLFESSANVSPVGIVPVPRVLSRRSPPHRDADPSTADQNALWLGERLPIFAAKGVARIRR